MKPAELLSNANGLLARPRFGLEGVWPRAVALLGRQALEGGLDAFWEKNLERMKDASRRTQLLCLDQFVRNRELSDGIKESWSALTRACHHHPFELSPTATELRISLVHVEALLAELANGGSRSD